MLVLAVAEDLNELLENGRLAAVAALCKSRRVVIVAVNVAVVFVIAVLRAEYSRAERACEVIDVVFAVEGCDI
jgi:hypothetical protein